MDTTTLILALAPVILIDLALLIFALVDLIRRDRRTVRGENKIIWALVILFLSTFGPILYLVFGRVEGREGLNG